MKARDEDLSEDKPFFAYLPFSAPHYPLQCSKADRQAYSGAYDDGPSKLRERRLERLKHLDIIGKDVVAHPVIDVDAQKQHYNDWEEMSDMERRKSARSMECFAGMVTRMDTNIGRVLNHLEVTGELDRESKTSGQADKKDTVVMFMSDNGAEGAWYGEHYNADTVDDRV